MPGEHVHPHVSETPWLDPPPRLAATYPGLRWSLAWQYAQHSVVYRLERGDVPELFVKLSLEGHYPTLAGEAERMRWAGA